MSKYYQLKIASLIVHLAIGGWGVRQELPWLYQLN